MRKRAHGRRRSSPQDGGTATARRWRPAFLVLAFGQAVSAFGSTLTLFALTWALWSTTASGLALGALWVVAAVPVVAVGPVAGALVDRWDRRLTLIFVDVAGAAATIGAAFAIAVWGLSYAVAYPLVLAVSLGRVFHVPAFNAVLPLVVREGHLGRANGFVAFTEGGSRVAAPIAGGALLAAGVDVSLVLAVDAATFALAAVSLALVEIAGSSPAAATAPTRFVASLAADVKDGFAYLWQWNALFALLMLFAVVNLFGSGLQVLLPQIVTEKFDSGPALLGSVEGAMGIGLLAGAAALTIWGGPKRRAVGVLVGLAAGAVLQTLAGLAAKPALFVAALGLAVAAWVMVNGIQTTLLQEAVAPAMHGRVFAFRRTLEQFTWPLSAALAGALAPGIVRPDVLLAVGGAASLAAVVVALAARPWLVERPAEDVEPAAPGVVRPSV